MGEAFAWMEGVLLMAVIAQRWRFRLLDESSHPEMHPAIDAQAESRDSRAKVEQRLVDAARSRAATNACVNRPRLAVSRHAASPASGGHSADTRDRGSPRVR